MRLGTFPEVKRLPPAQPKTTTTRNTSKVALHHTSTGTTVTPDIPTLLLPAAVGVVADLVIVGRIATHTMDARP